MCVARLPRASTDLVFSLHGRAAAAAAAAASSVESTASYPGDGTGGGSGSGSGDGGGDEACPSLAALVGTLEVANWGLFGDGGALAEDADTRYLGS